MATLILRCVDLALCAGLGLVLAWRLYRRGFTFDTTWHADAWLVLFGWAVLGVVGSAENLSQDNPGGSRLVIALVVAAWSIRVAVTYDRNQRKDD